MASGRLVMKYAHTEGHTEVCYDMSDSKILSAGSDGDVRIWEDFEGNQNPKHLKLAEKINDLAVKDGTIYAASHDNSVEKYNLSDGSPDGILLRFTADVTHISLAESLNSIAAASSDFTAKVFDLTLSEQKVFKGHKAPVLSIAVDPLDEYLATVSCDGNFCIWNLSDTSRAKTISVIKPCNDVCNSESLARVSWRPATGEDIAVPSGNEVKVYARGTWSLVHAFTSALTDKPFNCCAFSYCGRFLAAATVDGWICVWDAETHDCLQTIQHSLRTCICSLAWDPRENNSLAIADVRGQVGLVKDAVPSKKSKQDSVPDDLDALFEDEDGEMMDFVDDAAAESNDGLDDIPRLSSRKRTGIESDNDDIGSQDKNGPSDFDIPSTNNLLANDDALAPPDFPQTAKLPPDPLDDASSTNSNLNLLDDEKPKLKEVYTGPKPTAMQQAFQPSETPRYLSHRFMVWNSVGTVRSYSDDSESAIDIEFHDKKHHHALHIDNEAPGGGAYNTIADLSLNAVAFAAEGYEDVPSKLTCHHYASWDRKKEWSVEMPDEEDIKALTIGESWIAVCTSERLVRMYSLSGMQRLMFSIPGPVVSMAAHTDQLMIVYHMNQGFNGNQCLGFMLLEVGCGTGPNRPRKIVGGEPLPISKRSSLQWIGFTDEGTPVTVDDSGVVRMMNRGFSNAWVPVSYLRKLTKSRHDHYWVVGLRENPQELRCILCKGSTYPVTIPRPFPTILTFSLPLCDKASDKTKFEEEYWGLKLFSSHISYLESHGFETDEAHKNKVNVQQQQALMKMFALACKTEQQSRAYEICSMMSLASVTLAIKYASRLKQINLAQKLTEVAQEKTQEEMEAMQKLQRRQAQEEEDEDDEDDTNEDFQAEMQSGYSRADTEWQDHKKLSQAKKRQRPESDKEENDADEDVQIQASDDLPDFGKRNTATTLNQSKNDVEHAELGKARNPFKTKSASLASPTSVLDSITKRPSISQKLRGAIAKSHSLTKKPAADKGTKKQQTLFGSNSKFQLTSTPKGKKHASRQEDDPPNEQILKDLKNGTTTGVQLYVDDVRAKLAEENPDMDGVEVRKLGIQHFRKLPAEERKAWNEKAKHTVLTEALVTVNYAGGPKRKFESDEKAGAGDENTPDVIAIDDEESDQRKSKKSRTDYAASGKSITSTNSKLAGFAFSQD